MSDESTLAREALKARYLREAEAKFERDMAEAERLAAEYPGFIKLAAPSAEPSPAPAPAEPVKPSAAAAPDNDPLASVEGSVSLLVEHYLNDGDSPFQKLRFRTREN